MCRECTREGCIVNACQENKVQAVHMKRITRCRERTLRTSSGVHHRGVTARPLKKQEAQAVRNDERGTGRVQ